MRKTLSLFALFMLAFICPAAAQQVVIDEITIQGAESYTVNQEMVVRFQVTNNTGVPLAADDYSLSVNVGGVYAGKPAATKAIANGSYESFMAKVAPHKAGENLPVEIVFKGMGTTTATADQTVTVNAEVPSADVQIGNCAKPSSDTDYTGAFNTYYNYSQTEIVYTAADLGLADGTAMTGLSFTGYRENERIVPVKVWVELTDDVTPQSTGKTTMYTSDNLIEVYNDNYSFKAVGDSYSHESVFSVTFPTPINYVAGKSLRVIVQTAKASSYSYTYISIDKTKSGQVATRCVDQSMESLLAKQFKDNSYGTPYYLPILKLGIEKEPTVVDGTVTILNKSKEVEPLANATVALANGNIMYFATTDAAGKYNMEVCQDKLTYDVTVEPADAQIFPFVETLALAGTSATKNLQVTEATGAYILSAEFPETGVKNNTVTVKANIANYDAEDMSEENAKVILKLDGEQVAEATDLLIDAFDNDNVTLTFTPHVSGTKELAVEVYVNDKLQHSKSGNITISEEMAYGDFTIKGGENANETTSPIRLYSTHSYSQTLLTADMLSGLAAGSKITGLKLESAQSTNSKNFNFDVKVWVMNTEDGVDNITTDPHSADFKQVYAATLVQRYHGKYNDGAVTYENFFNLVFDEPFVYEGKNIRIAMRSDIEGDGYQQTYFKAIKDVRTSYSKSSDNPKIDGVAVDIMDYTWASAPAQTPVFTFVVDNASIVTGAVVDKATQTPIANAEVKLTADDADVYYTATTDAEGKFELSVIQANHNFTASVSAEGYQTAENAANISANFASPLDLGNIELEVVVTEAIVEVDPTVGWATYFDSEHAVKIPADVEAYVFTQLRDMAMPGLVKYSEFAEACGAEFQGVVPANEPIVLKASEDVVLKYADAPEFDSFAEMGANYLAGTDTEETTTVPAWAEGEFEANDLYYYAFSLNKENAPESVGFYWVDETGSVFTNKAHEAYLALPKEKFEPGNTQSAFLFNGETVTVASIVTGTVVDKATQAPIANAEVKLTATDDADTYYTATTDADGKFELSFSPANLDFKVSVSAEGYQTAENAANISANFASPLDLGNIELEVLITGTIVEVDPTIGWATFFDSEHAVKIPAGVEAYVFTQLRDMAMPGLVKYSEFAEACGAEFQGVVPANEPIVLKASEDVDLEYADAPEFDSFAEMGANYLAGTDTEETTTVPAWAEGEFEANEFYYYALSLNKENDPESVGFYWVDEEGTAFTNKAHEAYLALPKEMFEPGNTKSAYLFNGETVTAIKNANSSANSAVAPMFNLAGQRVNKNAKGILIKNGKKFMVK